MSREADFSSQIFFLIQEDNKFIIITKIIAMTYRVFTMYLALF